MGKKKTRGKTKSLKGLKKAPSQSIRTGGFIPPGSRIKTYRYSGELFYYIVFTVFLCLAVAAIVYIVFIRQDAFTPTAQNTLRFLFATVSGFLAAGFVGGIYVKWKHESGMTVSATSGFAVWLLTLLLFDLDWLS